MAIAWFFFIPLSIYHLLTWVSFNYLLDSSRILINIEEEGKTLYGAQSIYFLIQIIIDETTNNIFINSDGQQNCREYHS